MVLKVWGYYPPSAQYNNNYQSYGSPFTRRKHPKFLPLLEVTNHLTLSN